MDLTDAGHGQDSRASLTWDMARTVGPHGQWDLTVEGHGQDRGTSLTWVMATTVDLTDAGWSRESE